MAIIVWALSEVLEFLQIVAPKYAPVQVLYRLHVLWLLQQKAIPLKEKH